jgi:hypothetical protein
VKEEIKLDTDGVDIYRNAEKKGYLVKQVTFVSKLLTHFRVAELKHGRGDTLLLVITVFFISKAMRMWSQLELFH